jgi:hypothetical protein
VESDDIPLWRGCDETTVGIEGLFRRGAKKIRRDAAADFLFAISAIDESYFALPP